MFAAKPVEGLRTELKWLGTALGSRRDLDVMRDYLRRELVALDPPDRGVARGLIRRLDRTRGRSRDEVLAALDSPRYFTLIDRIEEFDEAWTWLGSFRRRQHRPRPRRPTFRATAHRRTSSPAVPPSPTPTPSGFRFCFSARCSAAA
jgi:CHAD domain-containing protein